MPNLKTAEEEMENEMVKEIKNKVSDCHKCEILVEWCEYICSCCDRKCKPVLPKEELAELINLHWTRGDEVGLFSALKQRDIQRDQAILTQILEGLEGEPNPYDSPNMTIQGSRFGQAYNKALQDAQELVKSILK